MGRACETSPRTRDDSERHQIKNSNKCSLYGGTMPLTVYSNHRVVTRSTTRGRF